MGPAPSPSISRSGLTAQRPKGEVAPPEPGANSWQLGPKPFLSVVTSTGLQATRRTSQLRKHWLQAFPEPPTPPLHCGQLSPAGEALSAVWESKVNLCSFVSARLTSGRYFRDTQGSLGPPRLRVPGMLSDGGRGGGERPKRQPPPLCECRSSDSEGPEPLLSDVGSTCCKLASEHLFKAPPGPHDDCEGWRRVALHGQHFLVASERNSRVYAIILNN